MFSFCRREGPVWGSDEIKFGAHSSATGDEFDEIRFPKWLFAAHIIKYEQFLKYQLLISPDDSQGVTIHSEWASLGQAKIFFSHPEVKAALEGNPQSSTPQIFYLDMLEEGLH